MKSVYLLSDSEMKFFPQFRIFVDVLEAWILGSHWV